MLQNHNKKSQKDIAKLLHGAICYCSTWQNHSTQQAVMSCGARLPVMWSNFTQQTLSTTNMMLCILVHFNFSTDILKVRILSTIFGLYVSERKWMFGRLQNTRGGLGLESQQSGCDKGELGPVGDQSLALALSRPLRRGGRCHLRPGRGWWGRPRW